MNESFHKQSPAAKLRPQSGMTTARRTGDLGYRLMMRRNLIGVTLSEIIPAVNDFLLDRLIGQSHGRSLPGYTTVVRESRRQGDHLKPKDGSQPELPCRHPRNRAFEFMNSDTDPDAQRLKEHVKALGEQF